MDFVCMKGFFDPFIQLLIGKSSALYEAADADKVPSLPYAQCYLTMVDHQNLVLMNIMVKESKGLADAQKFLLAEMKKIQFQTEGIDYKKVQKKLQEEHEKEKEQEQAENDAEKKAAD